MSEQEYASLRDNHEHLQRHFANSLTVGSKFLPEAQDMVVERVEAALMEKLAEAQEQGQPAGRVVMELMFDKAIGTDALVALNDPDAKLHNVIRDAGTPGETVVTAVEADQIPQTNKMTVVAGPYGPTGKWGIYTMFPGEEAPPFPNERQPEDVRAANEEFWNNHGFLATKTEIMAQTFAQNSKMTNGVAADKPQPHQAVTYTSQPKKLGT